MRPSHSKVIRVNGLRMSGSTLLIPVGPAESYQETLVKRLKRHRIKQYEVAEEMGITPSQFSRWVGRPSADTGKPMSIQLHNVVKIEQAIIAILARRDRVEGRVSRANKDKGVVRNSLETSRTSGPGRSVGLYRNGSRWWIRTVRGPLSGARKPLSTGTEDIVLAARIKALVDDLADDPGHAEFIEQALEGKVTLARLYSNHAAGTLGSLALRLGMRGRPSPHIARQSGNPAPTQAPR